MVCVYNSLIINTNHGEPKMIISDNASIKTELNSLYEQFESEELTVESLQEIQWQIDFLEHAYAASLEDFDYA